MQEGLLVLFEPHLAYIAGLSFVMCVALIAMARFIPRLAGRPSDTNAVQAMHRRPTPRVGGIAIFGALACSIFFSPIIITQGYIYFLMGAALLFFVGISEDLGFHVSPRLRLLTVVIASMFVIPLIGFWLSRIGVLYVDQLLQYGFIGIPFTLLITAGVSNGFNLIDGVNGLASMTAITASVAIAVIAHQSGYASMASVSMMLAAVTFGFFVANYPFGLIFLGDAGAYVLGFVISWIGVVIIMRVPEVSPWAILLTMFWPLADTLLAMYRRRRENKSAMMPDRLHAHQLVMRAIEICFVGRSRRATANPLTTLVIAPFVVAPPIVGVLLWDNNVAAFLSVLFFLALFFWSFVSLLSVVSSYRLRPEFRESDRKGVARQVIHKRHPRTQLSEEAF
jgi:UDP-N-acetylmuramyl pentapeptide phosphotransferase/UDP-N-acetylglucosamine-1-phosphate transferase